MEIDTRLRLPLYINPDFKDAFVNIVLDNYGFAEAISEGYVKVLYSCSDRISSLTPDTAVGVVTKIRYNANERYVEFNVTTRSYYANRLAELLEHKIPMYVIPYITVNAKSWSFDAFHGFVICMLPSDTNAAGFSDDFREFVRVEFDNRKEMEK